MGRSLRSSAWALGLLVTGAIVGTQTGSWIPLLGIAGLVYGFGALIDVRWVQEKIPIIRPADARYRELYAAGAALRDEIAQLGLALHNDRSMAVDRTPLNRRLRGWEDDYWGFMRRYFYSREPALRAGPWNVSDPLDYSGDDYNWSDVAIGYLQHRLKVLHELLPDLPE